MMKVCYKGNKTQDQFCDGKIVKFKNRDLKIKNNPKNFRADKIFHLQKNQYSRVY